MKRLTGAQPVFEAHTLTCSFGKAIAQTCQEDHAH